MDLQRVFPTMTEKPHHYHYLKEFRVERCQSFLERKCKNHKPFDCFNWHFLKQRRRRPVRNPKNGKFNYCPDTYCEKYDEETGICPDGDDCQFVHRTFGDVERRYHLRYYKTCKCEHDVDARGSCLQNGVHCAFAHGSRDQRPAVRAIGEIAVDRNDALKKGLPSIDPKWQDSNYVLSYYKTEPCTRPDLCRQGYGCPLYHTSKDKRRNPLNLGYKLAPCVNIKNGEEWDDPANCEYGENCHYCHTRIEQRFHPKIYKSTKCNDSREGGSCHRGVFCTFSHEPNAEPPTVLEDPSTLEPMDGKRDKVLEYDSNKILDKGCESANVGSNHSHIEALKAQLQQMDKSKEQNNTNGNWSQSLMNDQSRSDPTNVVEREQSDRAIFFDSTGKYSALDDFGSRLGTSICRLAPTGLLQNTSESVNVPNPVSKSDVLQNTSTRVDSPFNNFSPSNYSYTTSIRDPFSPISCSTQTPTPTQYESHSLSPLKRLSIPEIRLPTIDDIRQEYIQEMGLRKELKMIEFTRACEEVRKAMDTMFWF